MCRWNAYFGEPLLIDEDRVIVSEPLGDLSGAWLEVPESTALAVQPGTHEQLPFRPHYPLGRLPWMS